MKFTKMHGLGNDYLYVLGEPDHPRELAVRLSDRHFGAGADGMIWISPSHVADFKMRIFNADGSEAEMCGNGIRCVGKYVYDKGMTNHTSLTIETKAGIRNLDLIFSDGKVAAASVNMGKADVLSTQTLTFSGEQISYIPVLIGNPHAILFVSDVEAAPLTSLGPRISCHEAFPEGTNVEFVQVLDPHTLRMRVWERGSGVTMACGTGACASSAAAVALGLCPLNETIEVRLDGGSLSVLVQQDGTIIMTGPAETIYEGEVAL